MNSQLKPSRRIPQRGTDLETNTFPFAVSLQRCEFLGSHTDCLNGKTCRANKILLSWSSQTPILPLHQNLLFLISVLYLSKLHISLVYLLQILNRPLLHELFFYKKIDNFLYQLGLEKCKFMELQQLWMEGVVLIATEHKTMFQKVHSDIFFFLNSGYL